jgi:hypothetical protein
VLGKVTGSAGVEWLNEETRKAITPAIPKLVIILIFLFLKRIAKI